MTSQAAVTAHAPELADGLVLDQATDLLVAGPDGVRHITRMEGARR